MRVAAVQFCSTEDKQKNLVTALALTRKAIAQKARFIALPEIFHYRSASGVPASIEDIVEAIPGLSTMPFLELAREKNVFILAGSIYEKTGRPGRAYNTAVLMDPRGRIFAKYRKKNLFVARLGQRVIREDKVFLPGQKLTTAVLEDFKLGLAICYDLRFSEMFRGYARRGCDVLAVPSFFTKTTGAAHWEVLLRARAIETLSYVVAPNQSGGSDGGLLAYGNSMIVSPFGEILARAPAEGAAVIWADISRRALVEARAALPNILCGRKK